jgi:hypothetical protein
LRFPFLLLFATNVVVEWLTLLVRIREIKGSNPGPSTGYPNAFSWSFLPRKMSGQYLKFSHDRFFHILSKSSFTHSSFLSTLYSLSYWKCVIIKLQISNIIPFTLPPPLASFSSSFLDFNSLLFV